MGKKTYHYSWVRSSLIAQSSCRPNPPPVATGRLHCRPAAQEMVFDAHDWAFALFKGACGRGIYDNMKTAVDAIFVGKNSTTAASWRCAVIT